MTAYRRTAAVGLAAVALMTVVYRKWRQHRGVSAASGWTGRDVRGSGASG